MRKLRSRLHSELAERVAEVVLDGGLADEQPRRDLWIRLSLRGKPSDLPLLRGELVQRLNAPPPSVLACRLELKPCALGERLPPKSVKSS